MKQIFNQYRSILILTAVYIVLLGLIVVAGFNAFNTFSTVRAAKAEVDNLKHKQAILESNKALTQAQIGNYNKLLSQLIPDQEDYFSILFALEQLSAQTGFIITKYSINLAESSPEKLQIIVEGDGDSGAFLQFLQDYQFGGGRLITNENIEFTSDKIGQIKLDLNFYNKKVDSNLKDIPALTTKQIDLMRSIQAKTTVTFKSDAGSVADYKTKTNPF